VIDDAAAHRFEAQFTLWHKEIEKREARLLTPERAPRFAAVLHVDELRVLLATARARFEALQANPTGPQDLLTVQFELAWKELAAAIGRRMPRP